jgi:hypothetical protein
MGGPAEHVRVPPVERHCASRLPVGPQRQDQAAAESGMAIAISGSADEPLAWPSGQADIADLIMADHRRIRRLGDAVYDTARSAGHSGLEWMPGHVWQRFTGLLVAHFEAEEEVCYRPMSAAPRAARPRREAIGDHDDIREAVREASQLPPGSAPWWRTVTAALIACTEHLDREESGILAASLPGLTMNQRRMLGRQWLVLTASSGYTPGVPPSA